MERLVKSDAVLEHDGIGAKVGFGICSCILYALFPGIYAIIAPAISDAFGTEHYQVPAQRI